MGLALTADFLSLKWDGALTMEKSVVIILRTIQRQTFMSLKWDDRDFNDGTCRR